MCYICTGSGSVGKEICPECDGQKKLFIEGKPLDSVTRAGNLLFEAYKFLKTYSVWPVEGGILKQSSKFIRCIRWCDFVNYTSKDQTDKENKARAELKNKLGPLTGKRA